LVFLGIYHTDTEDTPKENLVGIKMAAGTPLFLKRGAVTPFFLKRGALALFLRGPVPLLRKKVVPAKKMISAKIPIAQ
jgi:hypothetical protein